MSKARFTPYNTPETPDFATEPTVRYSPLLKFLVKVLLWMVFAFIVSTITRNNVQQSKSAILEKRQIAWEMYQETFELLD